MKSCWNADQLNAVSEMTLILLQNRIPVKPSSLGKLKRHRGVFHELSMRKNSLKRRRQNLQKQPGSGFWQGSRVFPNMSSLSRTRVKLYKDSNTMLVKFLQEANEASSLRRYQSRTPGFKVQGSVFNLQTAQRRDRSR